MKLGYNTNGTAFHRWRDALELMAEIGYKAVAITIDHACLDPFSAQFADELDSMRSTLQRLNLASVIETGARFLLDSRQKHEPTLLSASADARRQRVDFLKRCIDIAAELNSEAVSFWSGICRVRVSTDMAMRWLADGCREAIDYAGEKNVKLGFEPEPGMFIETLEQFGRLTELVDAPHFGLTMDIGHIHCVEDGAIADHLREWSDRIVNVHIEDMNRGVHEHLRFGDGEIEFELVLSTLNEIGYSGCVNVELSRHCHMAPEVMRESFEFLTRSLNES